MKINIQGDYIRRHFFIFIIHLYLVVDRREIPGLKMSDKAFPRVYIFNIYKSTSSLHRALSLKNCAPEVYFPRTDGQSGVSVGCLKRLQEYVRKASPELWQPDDLVLLPWQHTWSKSFVCAWVFGLSEMDNRFPFTVFTRFNSLRLLFIPSQRDSKGKRFDAVEMAKVISQRSLEDFKSSSGASNNGKQDRTSVFDLNVNTFLLKSGVFWYIFPDIKRFTVKKSLCISCYETFASCLQQ